MPDIIAIPAKCPIQIAEELRIAFSLFLHDRGASANRIRVALEKLMDHLGIPKRRKTAKGKFEDLTLHKRIEVFETIHPTVGSHFMALKWLGNTGSHEGNASREEVLDAFELFENGLVEVIDRRSDRLAKMAKSMNQRHNPKSRKKKFF